MKKLPGSFSLIKDSVVDAFKNINLFLAAGAVYFVLLLLASMSSEIITRMSGKEIDAAIIIFTLFGLGFLGLIMLVARTLVLYRLTEVGMNIALGRTTEPASKKDASKYLLFVVLVAILSVVIGFATLLLIIPGIYLGVRLAFVPFAYIDRKKGIEDSFKESWRISKNNFWPILGRWIIGGLALGAVYLVVFLIYGAIALGLQKAFQLSMDQTYAFAGVAGIVWAFIFSLIKVMVIAIGLVYFGKLYKALKA